MTPGKSCSYEIIYIWNARFDDRHGNLECIPGRRKLLHNAVERRYKITVRGAYPDQRPSGIKTLPSSSSTIKKVSSIGTLEIKPQAKFDLPRIAGTVGATEKRRCHDAAEAVELLVVEQVLDITNKCHRRATPVLQPFQIDRFCQV